MFILFVLTVNGDSLQSDSSFAAQDTVPPDTVVFYDIPEIIQPGFTTTFLRTRTAGVAQLAPPYPACTMYTLLSRAYFLPLCYGPGYPLRILYRGDPACDTKLLINGHPANHPFWRIHDFSSVPLDHLECVLVGNDGFGEHVVDRRTKINRFPQPFSYFQFTTTANSTNIFNIDFTRALNNHFGLYASGIYEMSEGWRENAQYDQSSLYAHMYYWGNIRARTDLLYHTTTRGFPGNEPDTLNGEEWSTFIDCACAIGYEDHGMTLYFTSHDNQYQNDTLVEEVCQTETYGLQSEHIVRAGGVEFLFRPRGQLHTISSSSYGEFTLHDGEIACAITKDFHHVFASVANNLYLDANDDFATAPYLCLGARIHDSLRLAIDLSRRFRNPTVPETTSTGSSSIFYPYRGNVHLKEERSWSQNLHLYIPDLRITFYRDIFENLITPQGDTLYNIASWTTTGIEGVAALTATLHEDSTAQARTEIILGASGNYILAGESLPDITELHAAAYVTFSRQTERLGLSATACGQYVGERLTAYGETLDAFMNFSCTASVRVVTLAFTLHTDNISNAYYTLVPEYRMPLRTFRFTVKWEFWN